MEKQKAESGNPQSHEKLFNHKERKEPKEKILLCVLCVLCG
jgi:hypothetical protein